MRRGPTWQDSTRRRRLPANWDSEIRPAVFEREGRVCALAYPEVCTRYATEVDHKRRGDDHRIDNLQPACRPCHQRKTALEGVAARRPPLRRPPEQHPAL